MALTGKDIRIYSDMVESGNAKVAGVVNVWSNGNKIRRWAGQGENSEWHSPEKGYRKMVAILVEEDDA